MVVIQGNDTMTNRIYLSGQKYRFEIEEGGQPMYVIVDQEAGLTRVVNVAEQAALKMPCDDIRSLANDPFQSFKYTAANPEVSVSPAGTEVVNGLECEEATLVAYGGVVMTQWVSTKMGFPARIITHAQKDRTLELRNIEETVVDEELFNIPEGFSILEVPQARTASPPETAVPAFPAWVASVASAELATLPLERLLR